MEQPSALVSGEPDRAVELPPSGRGKLELSLLTTGAFVDTLNAMKFTVLVVDDDPSFRAIAVQILRRRGFEVAGEASDGAGAVAAVEALRPDGVLLDVHLPDGNGFDVAGRLSRLERAPRILLTSSDSYAGGQESAERCGAAGFTAKLELPTAQLECYFPPSA
jgi:CheY-like chemotaxis protein